MPSVRDLRTLFEPSPIHPLTTSEDTATNRESEQKAQPNGFVGFGHRGRIDSAAPDDNEAQYKNASMPQEWFSPSVETEQAEPGPSSPDRYFVQEGCSIAAAMSDDYPIVSAFVVPDNFYYVTDKNTNERESNVIVPGSPMSDSVVATADAVRFYRASLEYINEVNNKDQICQCPIPTPAKPENTNPPPPPPPRSSSSTAAVETLTTRSSLARAYPHLVKVSRYGPKKPKTPPPRLAPEHRPETAFSFQRPITPTPFVTRTAKVVPPNEPVLHKRISGPRLEEESLVPALNKQLERTLWYEERSRVKSDTTNLVTGSSARRTKIRYDKPQAQTPQPMVENGAKLHKFQWWKLRLFPKKEPQPFKVFRKMPSSMSMAAKTLANPTTIIIEPLSVLPVAPQPRMRARPKISPLGLLPHEAQHTGNRHVPTTPSPLRQAQRMDSVSTSATGAQSFTYNKKKMKLAKNKDMVKQETRPRAEVDPKNKKRAWWRISLRPRVKVERKKMVSQATEEEVACVRELREGRVVSAAQHADAHRGAQGRYGVNNRREALLDRPVVTVTATVAQKEAGRLRSTIRNV